MSWVSQSWGLISTCLFLIFGLPPSHLSLSLSLSLSLCLSLWPLHLVVPSYLLVVSSPYAFQHRFACSNVPFRVRRVLHISGLRSSTMLGERCWSGWRVDSRMMRTAALAAAALPPVAAAAAVGRVPAVQPGAAWWQWPRCRCRRLPCLRPCLGLAEGALGETDEVGVEPKAANQQDSLDCRRG